MGHGTKTPTTGLGGGGLNLSRSQPHQAMETDSDTRWSPRCSRKNFSPINLVENFGEGLFKVADEVVRMFETH